MRGLLVLALMALPLTAQAHHSSCKVLEGTEFASCGAHNEEGVEMNLLIAAPEVTTALNSAILCAGINKPFEKVEATWVEYKHDDYVGEVPSEPIISPIEFSPLNANCAVLRNIKLHRRGAWEVQVVFTDKDNGTFLLEVEDAPVSTPVQ